MSKHVDLTGNYFEHLGPYDCFFNALVYWIEYHNICTDELYTFNLDISYHPPTGIFSGSVEPHIFFIFLQKFFHIETNVYYLQELNEIPLNEIFILESNSYFFPNELDYYQKADHTKYVISKRIGSNKLLMWDPYDNETIISFLSDLYNRDKFKINGFYLSRTKCEKNTSVIIPYLLNKDYMKEYITVFNHAKKQVLYMKENNFNKLLLKNHYIFRKFYGCFRGIFMARERHFRSKTTPENGVEILTGWNRVQKDMTKFGLQFEGSDNELMISLESVFDKEIKYLNSYE
ncbi:hypothetical protein [Photorhabdus laumondii]|nr:hypothetical protein [Photorhabdus laumondii]